MQAPNQLSYPCIIQHFATISKPMPKFHSSSAITTKRVNCSPQSTQSTVNCSPQSTQSTVSLQHQHLPVATQNHHIFHHTKLLSLIKITWWHRNAHRSNMLYKQTQNSRELPLYDARSFITLTNLEPRTPPHSLATSFHTL